MEALEERSGEIMASVDLLPSNKGSIAGVDPAGTATLQHLHLLHIKLPSLPTTPAKGAVLNMVDNGEPVELKIEHSGSDISEHRSNGMDPQCPTSGSKNGSLKDMQKRYEVKFGVTTASDNSEYLKHKLSSQYGPPHMQRSSGDHDMVGFPQTQQRNLDDDALELDGLETERESTMQEELEASTPLKKHRSGRKAGGANQWTSVAEEIRRIVWKKRRNRAFPPQTLVWAKLDNCPWWPARVVSLEELPDDMYEKRLIGWTCIKFYGSPAVDKQPFAWLKRENLASYKKFPQDFVEQVFPERLQDGTFELAMKEIIKEARRRRCAEGASPITINNKNHVEERGDTSVEQQQSSTPLSSDGEAVVEAATKRMVNKEVNEVAGKTHLEHDSTEIVQGKHKQIKFKTVYGCEENLRAAKPHLQRERDHLHHRRIRARLRNRGEEMSFKRKRAATGEAGNEAVNFNGTRAVGTKMVVPLVESPSKKRISDLKFPHPDSRKKSFKEGSRSADAVKVLRQELEKQKKTGDDGYYYDCEVCGVGGELLCCDLCPRVYHLDCLVPPLKRTPTGKWVCPKCRNQSVAHKALASLNSNTKQQQKSTKGGEDWHSQKASSKEKQRLPSGLLEKSGKRLREEVDAKQLKKQRVRSKMNNDSGRGGEEQWPKCGDCGATISSSSMSGLCDICHADEVGEAKDISSVQASEEENAKQQKGKWLERCKTCGEHENLVNCTDCSGAFCKTCVFQPSGGALKSHWLCESCFVSGDHKHGYPSLHDEEVSFQVDRILGCRVMGKHSFKTSPTKQKVQSEQSEQGKIAVGGDAGDSFPVDATGAEEGSVEDLGAAGFMIVKRPRPASAAESQLYTVENQPGVEPMEIDFEPVANTGADILQGQAPSAKLQSVGCELGQSTHESQTEFEHCRERSLISMNGNTGEPLLASSSAGSREACEGSTSLVIEIGNTNSNRSVLETLSDVAEKSKGGLKGEISTKEICQARISSSSDDPGKETVVDANLESEGIGSEKKDIRGGSFPTARSAQNEEEFEFLVKWVGRSHIHNSWASESRLRLVAKRKLENYKSKYGTVPLVIMENQWLLPMRIVARQTLKSGSTEVLIKWHGLPYDECTWEPVGDPVVARNQQLLAAFDQFEKEATAKASRITVGGACRPSEIEPLVEQPDWLEGGSLFPHQMEALNWLRKSWYRQKNVILADEMGLGKTISACAFLSSLEHEFGTHAPCLVLVPLSTMPNWLAEFSLWAPSLNVIEYHGSAKARAVIREYEWHASSPTAGQDAKWSDHSTQVFKFNVMLTSYEMVIADSSQLRAVQWETLIVDEGHRLKNSESKLFNLLNTYSFGHRVLLTGTPLQNNLGELYNLLNFLQPDTFPCLAAFEDKFKSLSTADQVEELKKLIAPHMLRRLKKDAMQNIPPKMECVVPVELTSVQAEYYRALLTKNYQLLRQVCGGKTGGQQQSMLNIMMQLRKVCNHPYLLVGSEPKEGSPKFLQEMRIKASAKLTLLHSMLQILKKAGHRVLIFSQMTKLLDILEDYLSLQFGPKSFERVDGSVPVAERQAAITRFNQDPSRFVFLLSTRSCGLGINLATADTVIIYDSDFNPHADIQAMNRAHRIGQSKTLLVYRMVVRASVEERILQLAKKKLMLDHLFVSKLGSQKEIEDIIRWGTGELFQEGNSPQPENVQSLPQRLDTDDVINGEFKPEKKGGLLSPMDSARADDADTEESKEQLKKPPGLEDGDEKSHKKERLKTVWDDAAVARLLDRSELGTSNLDVVEGEAENDCLGSLKMWDWSEQDGLEEVEEEEIVTKDSEMATGAPDTTEEENKWEKLLRTRWEKLQTENEAALGRGKRLRKIVSYNESVVLKSIETSAEHSDEEELEEESAPDLVPEYTPAGRALKQKMARLRARQKDRLLRSREAQLRHTQDEKGTQGNYEPEKSSSLALDVDTRPAVHGKISDARAGWMLPFVDPPASARTGLPSSTELSVSTNEPNQRGIVLDMEHSWKGNVSYPQRIYTVPGIPVSCSHSISGIKGAQFAKTTGFAQPSSRESEAVPVDTGLLSATTDRDDPVRLERSSEQESRRPPMQASLRQLLPQGSHFPFGSSQQILRPPPLLFKSSRRSFGQSGGAAQSQAALSHLALEEVGPSGSQFPRTPVEENHGPGELLKGLPEFHGIGNLEHNVQRHLDRDSHDTGLLSNAGSAGTGSREHQVRTRTQELLQQTVSEKVAVTLPQLTPAPRSSAHLLPGEMDRHKSQSMRTPNLSMTLGFGGLAFSSHEQTLLARARANHDSHFAVQPETKSCAETLQSGDRFNPGDAMRLQIQKTGNPFNSNGNHVDEVDVSIQMDIREPSQSVGSQWGREEQRSRRLQLGKDDTVDNQVQPWTEDELDALWTGVRRHGFGNWLLMLQDQRLCFSRSRTASDLAEQWREEQLKMFGVPPLDLPRKTDMQNNGPYYGGKDRTSGGSRELFPEDFPLVGAAALVNQAVGSSLRGKDRKFGLEAMQSLDLASSRSGGLSAFPAKEPQSRSLKGLESSSRTELQGMLDSLRPSSAAGGRECPRPIISAELLHLSSAASLDEPDSNTVAAVSQETHSLPSDPKVPSPILGAGTGQSGEGVFPSKSFMPPPHIGGMLPGTLESQLASSASFAEMDKRRLQMGLVSKTNSFSTNDASQSLPHWLREVFKPATLSPTISATVEATTFLYKDCKTCLPPFIHPGTPPTPPKNFSKRNKRQERNTEGRVTGELDSIAGSELLPQTLPNPGLDQLKMQTQFPSLPASLQQFVEGLKSSLTGAVQPASMPPLSPSFSTKSLFDLSMPPPIEPSPQPTPFSRPSALEELMALKNLASISLPPTPPLNGSPLQSVFDINQIPQLGFSTSGPNVPLENDGQHGDKRVHTQASPDYHKSSSFDVLSRKHGGEAPLVHVHQPRIEICSEACALVRKQAGQPSLPAWLLSPVPNAKTNQEDVPTSRADLDRNGNDSSSETESDPLIHGKAGASRHEFYEISSDETISDDQTH